MKLSSGVAKIGFALIFLVVLAVTPAACEPLITIRVQNQTDSTLQIIGDDVFRGMAIPGGEVKYQTEVIYLYYVVIAKDIEGNVVYTANFTREDISGKRTYRVVIPPTAKSIEHSDNVTEK